MMTSEKICGYHITREAGKGTHGVVHVINDPRNSETAALKLIHSLPLEMGLPSLLELDIMARIRHPNLISSYFILTSMECQDFQQNDIGIVMPLANKDLSSFFYYPTVSHSLRDYSLSRQCKIMYDMASGLLFLHQNRILHLDIKVENIVLKEDMKTAMIIDYGLSLIEPVLGLGVYSNEERITIFYRPPEIIQKKSNDRYYYNDKCDVWSLGLVYLEILMGRYLFPPGSSNDPYDILQFYQANLSDTKRRPFLELNLQHLDSNTRHKYLDLLDWMLQYDPDRRYNMTQVIQSDIFNGFQPITGYQLTVESHGLCSITDITLGVDFILRKIVQSFTVETLFLSIDIYHRSLCYLECPDVDKKVNIILLAVISLVISYKVLNNGYYTEKYYLELLHNNMETEKIMSVRLNGHFEILERTILKNLQWIILRDYLYDLCQDINELVRCYPLFFSTNYLTLDLKKVRNELREENPNPLSKAITIYEYFHQVKKNSK
jgi:cyclin-dependent kinase 2